MGKLWIMHLYETEMQVPVGVRRGAWPLQVELESVVSCLMWLLGGNAGPLQKRCALFGTDISPDTVL